MKPPKHIPIKPKKLFLSTKIIRAGLILLNAALITFLTSIPFWKVFERSHANELNVFVYGAFFSPKTIHDFEEEYGVKVHLHVCSNNEEMLIKIRSAKPGDYDLIVASDYAVEILRDGEWVAPLDKKKLGFTPRIAPIFLNKEFDPGNVYSVPYAWEVYGIAENSRMVTIAETPSLKQLFDKKTAKHKIIMTPDPIEAFTLASFYLYQSTKSLTPKQIEETRILLRDQREWVEAYADFRAKYMIVTENSPIGIVKSSFLPELLKEDQDISFRLPQEATFTSIESLLIAKGAKHEEAAYQFMNHVFKKESYHETYKFCADFPTCLDAIEGSLHDTPKTKQIVNEILQRDDLVLFRYIMEPSELKEAWIFTKS